MKLSDKSRQILTLISAGHTYEQILALKPDFTYKDIFGAAEEALEIEISSNSSHQDRLADIKRHYPNAYEPWTPRQDEILTSMHKGGAPVKAIASALKRQPSAISSRTKKLGLNE